MIGAAIVFYIPNYYYMTPKGDGNVLSIVITPSLINYYYMTPKGDGNERFFIRSEWKI